MDRFTFVTPARVVSGWGAASDGTLAAEARRLGKRPLLVCGNSLKSSGMLDAIVASLESAGVHPALHTGVPPEPDLNAVARAMDAAAGCDSILAIGGGSALDVAKAAALAPLGIVIQDYFDGKSAVPADGALPILAAPTTAGTGSEATWVGVFTDKAVPRKSSIRGGAMLPKIVVLDAQLTVSCSPTVTAHSGLDAFVQAVESYTSVGANPLTDALSFNAAIRIGMVLTTAVENGDDRPAREEMLLGSYMAGVALNTSRLGLVHGLAHPVGALTGAAHGLLCGFFMPAVMRYNAPTVGAKYDRLANALGVRDLADHFDGLLDRYGIPRHLSRLGLRESDFDRVIADTLASGSSKANPRQVTADACCAILISGYRGEESPR